MKYQKLLNLLNKSSESKFVIRNWNIVNYQSNGNYDVGNELSITQKYWNLIFVITKSFTF